MLEVASLANWLHSFLNRKRYKNAVCGIQKKISIACNAISCIFLLEILVLMIVLAMATAMMVLVVMMAMVLLLVAAVKPMLVVVVVVVMVEMVVEVAVEVMALLIVVEAMLMVGSDCDGSVDAAEELKLKS